LEDVEPRAFNLSTFMIGVVFSWDTKFNNRQHFMHIICLSPVVTVQKNALVCCSHCGVQLLLTRN